MSLLRTAARTAVITGTATRVHHRTAAKQQAKWAAANAAPPAAQPVAPAPAAQQVAPAPVAPPVEAAPAAPDTGAMLDQLRQLGELRAAGVLTDAEFEAQKARSTFAAERDACRERRRPLRLQRGTAELCAGPHRQWYGAPHPYR